MANFRDELKKKLEESRKKVVEQVVEAFSARCVEAAELGDLSATMEMPHPGGEAWTSASDKERSAEILRRERPEGDQLPQDF